VVGVALVLGGEVLGEGDVTGDIKSKDNDDDENNNNITQMLVWKVYM
jgi:hypothetical protein